MKNCTKISFRKCQVEAGAKILGNGALQMEKLLRTPAKEMGSGLEDCSAPGRKCSPPHHTPEKTEAAKCPCSLIICVCGRWP